MNHPFLNSTRPEDPKDLHLHSEQVRDGSASFAREVRSDSSKQCAEANEHCLRITALRLLSGDQRRVRLIDTIVPQKLFHFGSLLLSVMTRGIGTSLLHSLVFVDVFSFFLCVHHGDHHHCPNDTHYYIAYCLE